MRILILVDCYIPSRKSSAKLTYDLGLEFRREGHDVTVLAPSAHVSQGCEVSIEDGLRVARVKTHRIKGAPKILRGVYEARLSSLVWEKAGTFLADHPSDLIVFYSPTIFWGALVRRLKSLWQCPAYLILRDIFPQWAVDAGVLRRGLIHKYFRRKERQQYEQADVIAVQSPGDLKYVACNTSHRNCRLEVLYNWATVHEADLPKTHYRIKLGLQNKVVFFYGGNLGVAQDVDNVLRLATSLSTYSDIHFLLVGDGVAIPRLRRIIAERKLQNILLVPPVSQREYLSMVSEFDVGLITLDRRLTTHNIPGKLLSYMQSGLPILGSINAGSDLFELIEKAEAGFCVENGEDKSFHIASLKLALDVQLRARMGNNARLLLERQFSVHAAVGQIVRSVSKANVL